MRRLFADFNTETDDGRIALTPSGSQASIARLTHPLSPGERVLLSDGDMEVEAVVESRVIPGIVGYAPERQVWLAVPDERTWREATPNSLLPPVLEQILPLPLSETRLTG